MKKMSMLTNHTVQPGNIHKQFNMMRTPTASVGASRSLYLFPNGATAGPLLSSGIPGVVAGGDSIPKNAFYYSGYPPAGAIPKEANSESPKNTTRSDAAAIPKEAATEDTKMIWGEPTWFLLHTMAEKIPEDTFIRHRDDILNVVYTICTNLPCNECSEHAKKYLSTTVNLRAGVRTRDDLKTVLFNFHNYVNWRKKYPIFSREELDQKYARANTKNIVYNFMIYFQDKSKNPNMLSTELYRSRIILQLRDWFKNNIGLFME